MRKNYALLLLAGAIVVAAVIVVVGTANRSGQKTASAPQANSSSLPPGHPDINNGSGSSGSTKTPDYSEMIASLKAKLDKNPGDTRTMDALGTAYFMSEQYDKAQSLYERALKLKPGDPGATVQLAMVLHAKGNDAKAKSLIEGVLKKRPDFQEAHYNLAIIYFSQQQTDLAKKEWEKTAEIDPTTKVGQQAQNFVDMMEGRTPAPSGEAAQ